MVDKPKGKLTIERKVASEQERFVSTFFFGLVENENYRKKKLYNEHIENEQVSVV